MAALPLQRQCGREKIRNLSGQYGFRSGGIFDAYFGLKTSNLTMGPGVSGGLALKVSLIAGSLCSPLFTWQDSLWPDGLSKLRLVTTLPASLTSHMSAGPSDGARSWAQTQRRQVGRASDVLRSE